MYIILSGNHPTPHPTPQIKWVGTPTLKKLGICVLGSRGVKHSFSARKYSPPLFLKINQIRRVRELTGSP
jgi:hypothetical protein